MHRQRGDFSVGHLKDKSSGGKSSAWWQTPPALAKPTGASAREAEVMEHKNTRKLSHLKVTLHMIRYHLSYNAHMHLSNGIALKTSIVLYVNLSCDQVWGRKRQKGADSIFNIQRSTFSSPSFPNLLPHFPIPVTP